MSTLSLSPRYDLYRFQLPSEFLPKEVSEKWQKYLSKEPGVIISPIDYLNESIKGFKLPGIQDINITQEQHSWNGVQRINSKPGQPGRLNVEPKHDNTYVGPQNPLDLIERKFDVTFRLNQGLYNYFMLYEAIFYRMCKPHLYKDGDEFFIDILNEDGVAVSQVQLSQCHPEGIEGLDFSYDKVERQSDTFTCSWAFNNINYEMLNVQDVP